MRDRACGRLSLGAERRGFAASTWPRPPLWATRAPPILSLFSRPHTEEFRCGGTRGLWLLIAIFRVRVRLGVASAETCLSPFVKRLDRPEKFLYVFCVDADAKDNDFVAVIDVNPDSAAPPAP